MDFIYFILDILKTFQVKLELCYGNVSIKIYLGVFVLGKYIGLQSFYILVIYKTKMKSIVSKIVISLFFTHPVNFKVFLVNSKKHLHGFKDFTYN